MAAIPTTTASHEPLLHAQDVQRPCHITAMGSDTEHKQELASELVANADLIVADSRAQCETRGEIARARAEGALDAAAEARIVELGDVLAGRAAGRTSETRLSIADLTGVAVQDVCIAAAVIAALDA